MLRKFAALSLVLSTVVGCETVGSTASIEQRSYLDPSEVGGYGAAADSQQVGTAPLMASNENRAPKPDAPLAAPEATPSTAQLTKRLVVYSASIRLVVASTADAMGSVQAIARDANGYLQESDARSLTIRVPAERFEASVAAIEKLGEVVDRAVKASDVSEQMLDLDIRLDNARAARERLKAHLAKSEKMEDTIKLESELSRVTTEIELLEGKQRLLSSQVAMSTIRVELNASRPQTTRGEAAASPFGWIQRLGDGVVAGAAEAMPRQPKFLAAGPKFEPPAGFVRYFSSNDLVEAMNADGLRIKVQRQANFDRGSLEFWRSLARRSLVETRAIASNSADQLPEDANWSRFVGTREAGGKQLTYLLLMTRTNDDVYTFEAWGPSEQMTPVMPALIASGRSLKR